MNGTQGHLNTHELLALSALRGDIQTGASQRRLALSLDRLRTELLLNRTGFALALADADADTLLADNQINGRVSLYGEAKSDEALDLDLLKNLGVARWRTQSACPRRILNTP